MIPEHCCIDDIPWIRGQVAQLIPIRRVRAVNEYARAFQAAYDAEPVNRAKLATARFHANTRLRKYVERAKSAEHP